ncbi:MAG: tRNA (adenine-N1)-methyltransferase, partial [Desulfovibrionaceae bacterium]|nr:tRNA (adenine-N1)-methyltransferase [Desulfovibrionaceae bacterium]
MLKSGELAILFNPAGKRYLRQIEAGQEMHTAHGSISMDQVLAAGYGSLVESSQGMPYKILRPTLKDLLKGVKRQTQIIYPKDIAYICMRLGVGNGTRIIEAGSGSGSLTLALSWFTGNNGHVYTYEAREEFYKL